MIILNRILIGHALPAMPVLFNAQGIWKHLLQRDTASDAGISDTVHGRKWKALISGLRLRF